MSEERLIHLLKPKEFRTWCRPNNVPGDFDITTMPSKVTCAVCLGAMRAKTQKNHRHFRVAHVASTRRDR